MSKDEKVNFHNELAAAVAGLKKLWNLIIIKKLLLLYYNN
jgi:hypothetical protein